MPDTPSANGGAVPGQAPDDEVGVMLAVRRERTRELVGVARRHIEAGEWDAACRALRRCTVSAWVAEAPELMSSLAIGFASLPEGTTVDAAEAPELMLLFGVLRHTVTGETRAVQSDIRTAVAALLRADTTDPVARLGTLALAAFGQLLVDRPDDAAATLTRGHELLEGLDPAVRTRRRDEVAPAMCDAAVVGVLLDRIPESLPLWQWVSDNVADLSSPLLAQAELGLACGQLILGNTSRVSAAWRARLESGDLTPFEAVREWAGLVGAARALRLLDASQPQAALEQTRRSLALQPDPRLLVTLSLVHVFALLAVRRTDEAVRYVESWTIPSEGARTARRLRRRLSDLIAVFRDHPLEGEPGETDAVPGTVSTVFELLGPVVVDPRYAVEIDRPRLRVSGWMTVAVAQARLGHEHACAESLRQIESISLEHDLGCHYWTAPPSALPELADIARRHGVDGVADRLAQVIAADAAAGRADTPAEPLTDREFEVLALVAAGLSNAEIGKRLFVSPNTVKFHLSRIYRKWSVDSRDEAIASAIAQFGPTALERAVASIAARAAHSD